MPDYKSGIIILYYPISNTHTRMPLLVIQTILLLPIRKNRIDIGTLQLYLDK